MSHFNEHTLEMAIMELFEQQGYSYVNGETIHKEVLLRDDLRMYLTDRYAQDGITSLEVERVIAKLMADNGAPLYLQNAQTYRLMTEGFAIKREDASQPDLFVEVIDFKDADRNIFKIVNQLEIKGLERRIPDGIVYVNGLPVVVLEFKSAVKEDTTIMNAYTQLTVRYRRDIPELFRYNAFVVISDGVNNKYGTLFTPYEFFYAWRKVERTDKAKYTDWANRSDIKSELQMDLILILAEHGYPPVPQDEVFKEIFEQAENFKKYEQADEEVAEKATPVVHVPYTSNY